MRIDTLLHEEIADEFEHLNKMEVGTETYRTTVDGLTKLMDRAIEIEKLEIEEQERREARESDNEFRAKQMEEEKKSRWISHAINVAGIIIPVGVTVWGTFKTFKFEETGTITTMMGRGFINKLLPKK